VVHIVAGLLRERLDGLEIDGEGIGGTGGDRGVGEPDPLVLGGSAVRSGPCGVKVAVVEQRVDEYRAVPRPGGPDLRVPAELGECLGPFHLPGS
jgi:hypothetical protein